jgi:anaerobic selenocysteine-containing dehydrogenase
MPLARAVKPAASAASRLWRSPEKDCRLASTLRRWRTVASSYFGASTCSRHAVTDPIRTRTAQQCDEHVQLRPGSDAVFAAGMGRVMLEEGLVDLEFARGACADFDDLAHQLAPWAPDRVAEACGIAAETRAGQRWT